MSNPLRNNNIRTSRAARALLLTLMTVQLTALAPTASAEEETPPRNGGQTSQQSVEDPGSTPVDEDDEMPRAIALTEASVVFIDLRAKAWVNDTYDWLNDGKPYVLTSHCSGAVVDPDGYVLTAGHCVDPASWRSSFLEAGVAEWIRNKWHVRDDGSRYTVDQLLGWADSEWTVEGKSKGSPIEITATVGFGASVDGLDAGRTFTARIVDYRPLDEGDVALLKIEASDLTALPIAAGEDIDVGDRVMTVGYPGSVDSVTDPSYTAAFKNGTISAARTRGNGAVPVYELSAALSGGMSGGPTVNYEGQIVGVNSFKIRGEAQHFNFVSPSSLARELLHRNGVTQDDLGEVTTAYRTGVNAHFAGDHETAVAAFDQVLDVVESHAQAKELRRSSQEQIPDEPASPEPSAAESTEAPVSQRNASAGTPGTPVGPSTPTIPAVAMIPVLVLAGAAFMLGRRGGDGLPAT